MTKATGLETVAKQLSEVVDRMSDDYLALKAELDQAVGVIEDRSSEYKALEAKLAAERAKKEMLAESLHIQIKRVNELEADNAAKDVIIERHREAQVILGKQLDEVIADNAVKDKLIQSLIDFDSEEVKRLEADLMVARASRDSWKRTHAIACERYEAQIKELNK